jgi:arylsulfatase A-like enzyme
MNNEVSPTLTQVRSFLRRLRITRKYFEPNKGPQDLRDWFADNGWFLVDINSIGNEDGDTRDEWLHWMIKETDIFEKPDDKPSSPQLGAQKKKKKRKSSKKKKLTRKR